MNIMEEEVISEGNTLTEKVPQRENNDLEYKDVLCRPNRTVVYWHPACSKHCIEEHIEQPKRVEHIMKALRHKLADRVVFRESPLASIEDTKLFHDSKMVAKFESLWKDTQDAFLKNKKVIVRSIDGDTQIMHATREAALRAVGALLAAVDHVYLSRDDPHHIDTAFCCIRPPGHHAETNRACGFCFFNNCAIAAKYAQQRYGVKKVAILDFDVHHGNGSEEGFENDETVFYGSTHEYGNFPGTGKDPTPHTGDAAKLERHRRIVNRYLHSGSSSREEFRSKWLEILQEMERFSPELIIISAGFDAHDDDPLSDIELTDSDYEWITRQILLSALKLSVAALKAGSGRHVCVLSALEGGYDLDAISRSSVLHVAALQKGFEGVWEEYEKLLIEAKQEQDGFGGDEVAALTAELSAMGVFDIIDIDPSGNEQEAKESQIST